MVELRWFVTFFFLSFIATTLTWLVSVVSGVALMPFSAVVVMLVLFIGTLLIAK